MTLMYSFKVNDIEIGPTDGTGANLVLDGSKIILTRNNTAGNTAEIIVTQEAITFANIHAGNEIIISRGENNPTEDVIFIGNVKKIRKMEDDTIRLLCTDILHQLKYKFFIASYDRNVDPQNGELSEIFLDIAQRGGFDVSRIRSGNTPGDITADKFKSINHSRLNRLALIERILNWVFYYDYNNRWIRLEPKGQLVFPTPLIVGQNIVNLPVWEEDIEHMRNNITINGASKFDTRINTFTGDGSTRTFTLDFEPETIELTVGGVLKRLGVPGSDTTFDYSLDKDLKRVTFVEAPADTASIVVSYSTYLPTPVKGKNTESIEKYGLEQETILEFPDVVTVEDAEVRLEQLKNLLGEGEYSTVLFTTEFKIPLGSTISYQNPYDDDRDDSYLVQEKIVNYGEAYDIIKIGNPRIDLTEVFMTIEERLSLLEDSDRKLANILRQVISLIRARTRFFRKSLQLEKRNMGTSWTLGHVTLGQTRDTINTEADCSGNNNHGEWTI